MSNRIQKVNSLLEHEISSIIQKEIILPDNTMATLTHVDSSSNLIEAKVYISVFPEDKTDQALKALKDDIFNIQKILNRKLNMRPVPKIIFVSDKVSAEAGKIETILAKLKKEEK